MIDKKVVVVATGGTIAMKYDKEKHGLVPACSGKDLADAVPGLGDIAPPGIRAVFQYRFSRHDSAKYVGSALQD